MASISDGQKQPNDAIGSGSKVTVGFLWAIVGMFVAGAILYINDVRQRGQIETKVEVLTTTVESALQTLVDIKQGVAKLADGQELKIEKLTDRIRANEQSILLMKAEIENIRKIVQK